MNQQSIAATPQREPAVSATAISLQQAVDNLNMAAESLIGRLDCVLGPLGSGQSVADEPRPPPMCRLADFLDNEASRVRSVTTAILATIERLEVGP